jgi:hypothetical protein
VARRFPVISLREITAEALGSSRKSTIWLLLDPVFGLFPCIFAADLGFAPRDGFATDWDLRQLVLCRNSANPKLVQFRSLAGWHHRRSRPISGTLANVARQPWTPPALLKDGELMPQGEDLEVQRGA